jgi:5-formyltetrahydrofolate cyclo-ligase
MSDDTDKTALRTLSRTRRRAFLTSLDPLAHRLAFKAVPSPLARRLADMQTVALYMGLDDEAPAQRLAPQLTAMGKTLALPRVIDRLGSMDFLAWTPEASTAPIIPNPAGQR